MEFHKIPYITKAIASDVAMVEYSATFLKLNQRNSVSAGALMQTMVTTVTSLTAKMATLPMHTEEEVAVYRAMEQVKDNIHRLTIRCADRVTEDGGNLLPYLIFRVKGQRALGTSKSLDRLRQIMNLCRDAQDQDECEEWMQDNYEIQQCSDCGEYEYKSNIVETYHEDDVCRYCLDSNYRYSEVYDRYVHEDSARSALDEEGDHVVIDENDDDYSYDERMDTYVHHNYTTPPPPVIGRYHGSKNEQRPIKDDWSTSKHRWFGVELEVEIKDHAIEPHEKARVLNELLNGGERGAKVFFESDGSLSNGFEIISQPMSLPAHRELWSWLRDRDACRHLLSHNTRTCGLHVHVNKDNLTQLQIAKIVTFINDPANEQLIRAIARRYAEGYCKIKQKSFDSAHQSTDRYEAVNITSQKTIEFRVFKGSLKYESVIAAIEFCNALVEFAANSITNDVTKLTTDHFIEFINNQGTEESPTLRPYINAVLQTA